MKFFLKCTPPPSSFWPRFYIVVLGIVFFISADLLSIFYLDFFIPSLFWLLVPFSIWIFFQLNFSWISVEFQLNFSWISVLFQLFFYSIAVTFWISCKCFFLYIILKGKSCQIMVTPRTSLFRHPCLASLNPEYSCMTWLSDFVLALKAVSFILTCYCSIYMQ